MEDIFPSYSCTNVKSKHLSPHKGHLDKAMSRGFVRCVCDNSVNQSLFICAEKRRVENFSRFKLDCTIQAIQVSNTVSMKSPYA